jgi:hypothetical protein
MADRLTQTSVMESRPAEKRYLIRDIVIQGLVLRVEPSGKKTYYVDYYQPGNRRRTSFKLGSAKLLTVAQAREAAREFLANVSLGEDPGEERRKARGETLEAFITDCYAPWVTENRKSGQATVNMILATFTPFLEKRITEITPFMMEQWKTRVRKERKLKASTVNRNVTALKAALNWGVKHGVIPENPIKGVEALQERDSVSKVRYLIPRGGEEALRGSGRTGGTGQAGKGALQPLAPRKEEGSAARSEGTPLCRLPEAHGDPVPEHGDPPRIAFLSGVA